MTTKQTPSTMVWPQNGAIRELVRKLADMLRFIRNDLDNGTTTFIRQTVAGIGNTDITTFDNGQIQFITDSADSNKVYLVTRVSDTLYKEELETL